MKRISVSVWVATTLVAGCTGLGGAPDAKQPAAPAKVATAVPAAPAAVPAPVLPMASASALAGSCSACHGQGGVSKGPSIPTNAGVSQEYFIDTMKGFKTGKHH